MLAVGRYLMKLAICKAIAKHSGFSALAVVTLYDSIGSFDAVISICDYATHSGIENLTTAALEHLGRRKYERLWRLHHEPFHAQCRCVINTRPTVHEPDAAVPQ